MRPGEGLEGGVEVLTPRLAQQAGLPRLLEMLRRQAPLPEQGPDPHIHPRAQGLHQIARQGLAAIVQVMEKTNERVQTGVMASADRLEMDQGIGQR